MGNKSCQCQGRPIVAKSKAPTLEFTGAQSISWQCVLCQYSRQTLGQHGSPEPGGPIIMESWPPTGPISRNIFGLTMTPSSWGMPPHGGIGDPQTRRAVRWEAADKKAARARIGPAGECLIRLACIAVDLHVDTGQPGPSVMMRKELVVGPALLRCMRQDGFMSTLMDPCLRPFEISMALLKSCRGYGSDAIPREVINPRAMKSMVGL